MIAKSFEFKYVLGEIVWFMHNDKVYCGVVKHYEIRHSGDMIIKSSRPTEIPTFDMSYLTSEILYRVQVIETTGDCQPDRITSQELDFLESSLFESKSALIESL